MAQINQFGSAAPGQGGSTRDCLRYEAMLADVIDGTLSAEDQAAFDRHRETCDSCSVMLEDARRGAAWLDMLRSDPPVPSGRLVDRILAETNVRAAHEAEAARAAHRAATEAASLLGHAASLTASPFLAEPVKVLSFRSRVPAPLRPAVSTVLQPRFAMTAAMAFFSVALTLNLTGVRLSELHARDLRPASVRRSFYEANAHVVRYYENLRVVYELESRVRDLQRSSDSDPAPAPANPKSEEQKDRKGDGSAPAGQQKPAGKPHSGLSSGTDRRESQGTTSPLLDPGAEPALSRRHPVFVMPNGAIVPVSFSSNSPDRQKRGLV